MEFAEGDEFDMSEDEEEAGSGFGPDSDEEVEEEMGLESPFDILGLYRGVSLAGQEGSQPPALPDMIYLYRRPILDYWCETGEDLAHVVRHVLIHEIGHHFGLSDDDMEAIEAEMD